MAGIISLQVEPFVNIDGSGNVTVRGVAELSQPVPFGSGEFTGGGFDYIINPLLTEGETALLIAQAAADFVNGSIIGTGVSFTTADVRRFY